MAYCWPFSSHICHMRGFTVNRFPTTLLAYRSAIYPQGMTFLICPGRQATLEQANEKGIRSHLHDRGPPSYCYHCPLFGPLALFFCYAGSRTQTCSRYRRWPNVGGGLAARKTDLTNQADLGKIVQTRHLQYMEDQKI